MRYIRYARKSEPDEGRQEKSIEQQREIMRQEAHRHGLHIVKEIEESVSAKVPGKRQGYEEMVQWLKQGRAEAILVYHENRLARNPLESGELQQLLQDGFIKEIRTHETIYRPDDNALLFAVISSMSNQYSRDLSTHVKRGMSGKRAEGWYPHCAPEGYRNNTYDHTIEIDEPRFTLLRHAWDLMLTGSYSVAQVLRILNQELGYTTRAQRKRGGGPLARSALYRIFNNVFYTGRWLEKGVLYEGKHTPMVSIYEFNQVQEILDKPGKAQRKTHEFAFSGLLQCARCGCMVSAELQRGRHGKGQYIYYHCSNGRKLCNKVSINERDLEQQIDDLLHRISIDPVVKDIALEDIRNWQKTTSGDRETLFSQQQKALLDAERKMNRLVQMYLNELFDDDNEYRARKTELQVEINRLKLEVEASQEEFARITETAENAFHFAAHARDQFLLGDIKHKREVARALGLSYSFNEGTISIDLHPALAAIYTIKQAYEYRDITSAVEQESAGIEPLKDGSGKKKDGALQSSVSFGWPKGMLYETFKEVAYFPKLACRS